MSTPSPRATAASMNCKVGSAKSQTEHFRCATMVCNVHSSRLEKEAGNMSPHLPSCKCNSTELHAAKKSMANRPATFQFGSACSGRQGPLRTCCSSTFPGNSRCCKFHALQAASGSSKRRCFRNRRGHAFACPRISGSTACTGTQSTWKLSPAGQRQSQSSTVKFSEFSSQLGRQRSLLQHAGVTWLGAPLLLQESENGSDRRNPRT